MIIKYIRFDPLKLLKNGQRSVLSEIIKIYDSMDLLDSIIPYAKKLGHMMVRNSMGRVNGTSQNIHVE